MLFTVWVEACFLSTIQSKIGQQTVYSLSMINGESIKFLQSYWDFQVNETMITGFKSPYEEIDLRSGLDRHRDLVLSGWKQRAECDGRVADDEAVLAQAQWGTEYELDALQNTCIHKIGYIL